MRLANPFRHLRRGAAFAVLGVVLTTVALSLSQCRMVDERLTGVSLDCAKPDRCMASCARQLAESTVREAFRHVANVKACNRDSVCIALENIRYAGALRQIKADYRACLANCHHQGSGGGGR